jgi:hypothetical protein
MLSDNIGQLLATSMLSMNFLLVSGFHENSCSSDASLVHVYSFSL